MVETEHLAYEGELECKVEAFNYAGVSKSVEILVTNPIIIVELFYM